MIRITKIKVQNFFGLNSLRVVGIKRIPPIEQLLSMMSYYKEQADNGHYNNPYDTEGELICKLDQIDGLPEDEYYDLVKKIHDIGMSFWSM